MNTTILRWGNKIKQAGFYIPFTVYFFVFVVAAAFGWRALHSGTIQADTAFADIYALLLDVALWFSLAIVSLALLSVVLSFVFFLYHKRKKGLDFRIETDLKESELHEKQTVRLFIHPVLKPFFGFVGAVR